MEEGGGRNEDDDDDFDGEVEGVEEDEALENSARNVNASSNSWGMLWVLLMTAATLVGRRALRGGFPYPICFLLLLQTTAYLGVSLTLLAIKCKELLLWDLERKCVAEREYTWYETFVLGVRLVLRILIDTAAMMAGAEAVRSYPNFAVMAVLPIFTYILDSALSRSAVALRMMKSDHRTTKEGLLRVLFAFFCVVLAVYDDYRLNFRGLLFAVASFSLVSLGKLIPRLGQRIDNGSVHTWDCPLYMYLLTEIAPIVVTAFAACKFEDFGSAFWTVWSWGFWGLLSSVAPGALLLVVFKCSMNTPYPFSTSSPGVLEDNSPQAKNAIATTLQASFWVACSGVFLCEKNLVDWMQVLAFVLLYVVGAGTRQIGFYPPRLMNLIARVLRKPQQKIPNEPWQLPFFRWVTTSIFTALFSSSILYWNVNYAYARDAENWVGAHEPSLDSAYVPPQPYNLDIVIAHSTGDSLQSISDLISTFASLESLQPSYPNIKIYSKDTSLNDTSFGRIHNASGLNSPGPVTATILSNTGGTAATFLHHILYTWEFLPAQTLFLSTSSSSFTTLSNSLQRFEDYFVPALPIHSERHDEPTTSFLNLGAYSTCACSSCSDDEGWMDTFHLIPSMFGAAYPSSTSPCKSALLTHGNNFVASADRIRGLGRDVWQMLYDALTNINLRDAWAHDAAKIPNLGEGKDGQEAFGEEDSVMSPYLGYTIERLWAVLLQCESAELAWRCPDVGRGWRRGGERGDCACLH